MSDANVKHKVLQYQDHLHTCILGDDPGLAGGLHQQGVLQAAQLEGAGETLQEVLLIPSSAIAIDIKIEIIDQFS